MIFNSINMVFNNLNDLFCVVKIKFKKNCFHDGGEFTDGDFKFLTINKLAGLYLSWSCPRDN